MSVGVTALSRAIGKVATLGSSGHRLYSVDECISGKGLYAAILSTLGWYWHKSQNVGIVTTLKEVMHVIAREKLLKIHCLFKSLIGNQKSFKCKR